MNGLTVEVTNTDAEGRLILADAMTWAERSGATHIVDVATLTGVAAAAFAPHADIVNSGTRDGSLIKSAVFLSEFVTVPWVHIDIAGTAYLGTEKPYAPKGATGAAVSTLARLALDFARDDSPD
jgi:leucyl aminopeptidase